MTRTTARSLAVGLAIVGATAAPAGAAGSASLPPTEPVTVAEHLAGPLTFDVGAGRTLYVGQAFSSTLTMVDKKGQATDLAAGPVPGDVAAVSEREGVLTWAETAYGEEGPVSSTLMRRSIDGTVTMLADLFAYETANNPDASLSYGFQGLDEACASLLPPFLLPAGGGVDSHPYGSVSVGGATYVADAGANAIFKVTDDGTVSTLAVIPGRSIMITEAMAAANDVPSCVADHVYVAEAVPTDVELGKNGALYVTSLPGGPEDDSLGANGSVYRVDPATGAVTLVASGFLGATGLAVAPNGTIYVAELFANKVSAISRDGTVSTVMELPSPAAVEWSNGRLYVSTNVFGDGSIVSFKVR